MTPRAVVFGAAGQLGVELMRELAARGYRTLGFDRGEIDITNGAAVEAAVAAHEAGVVFNCAAYNQVDVAEREPEAAWRINALAVRHMAPACRQADARLVQFSTDYVFDGFAHYPYPRTTARTRSALTRFRSSAESCTRRPASTTRWSCAPRASTGRPDATPGAAISSN